MRRALIPGLSLSLAMLAHGTARAQEPTAFGERGQLVVTADRLVPLVGYTTQSITSVLGDETVKVTESGGSMAFFIGEEPQLGVMHTVPRAAADFTVLRRLTLGASIAVAFGVDGVRTEERRAQGAPATTRENTVPGSTVLGFAPRAGYVVPLGRTFAFWPRAGLAFYSVRSERHETTNTGVTSTATETDTIFSLDLDPQLVWTPLPHVLVHAGPLANLPLTGSHETSFAQGAETKDRSDALTVFHLGISAGLGVWFDL